MMKRNLDESLSDSWESYSDTDDYDESSTFSYSDDDSSDEDDSWWYDIEDY